MTTTRGTFRPSIHYYGIMLESAPGSITNKNINGLNQGTSGCQEGNAIEVRNNAPFDGNHPATVSVTVSGNDVAFTKKQVSWQMVMFM
jgi:hypothetical protein